jgi:hypothetical protein
MTHIAIQEKLDGKVVDWMEQVSDKRRLLEGSPDTIESRVQARSSCAERDRGVACGPGGPRYSRTRESSQR